MRVYVIRYTDGLNLTLLLTDLTQGFLRPSHDEISSADLCFWILNDWNSCCSAFDLHWPLAARFTFRSVYYWTPFISICPVLFCRLKSYSHGHDAIPNPPPFNVVVQFEGLLDQSDVSLPGFQGFVADTVRQRPISR
jgi:hypothetical protein